MVDPKAAPAQPESRKRGGTGSLQKKVAEAVAEEAQAHPGVPVEAFATDEHRLGLKPVVRSVWAPVGVRPIASGHHRFEWLYVTAFVSPATGEGFWYVSNGVSKPFFEALLATFAQESGAGRDRIIVLILDNAGWHGETNLKVPDGIRLLFLPPYTPELQPAEHLWELVDEPIINTHVADIETLDAIVSDRCAQLAQDRQTIKGRTGFHWWPKIANAS
jgi:transposase